MEAVTPDAYGLLINGKLVAIVFDERQANLLWARAVYFRSERKGVHHVRICRMVLQ